MPGQPQGLIFDLDGTLVDSYDAITEALNAARVDVGLPALGTAEVRREVGRGLAYLVDRLVGHQHRDRAVAVFEECYRRVCVPRTRLLPGVASGLRELRRIGLVLAVASNKPTALSRQLLDALDLSRHLVAILGPEDVGAPKPEAAMLHACLERMGRTRREVLYVGDMPLDVETARRAGLAAVLLCAGAREPRELQALAAPDVAVYAGLADLVAVLQENRGRFS